MIGNLDGSIKLIKVCFICHGNICRSPMAEFIMKDKINKLNLQDKFYIDSKATSSEELGNNIHPGTKKILDKNNILYSGAGENIEKAYEAFCIKKEGKTVAVISVCENEFGTSSENKYGTAGYNPRRLLNQIKKEKLCLTKVNS